MFDLHALFCYNDIIIIPYYLLHISAACK